MNKKTFTIIMVSLLVVSILRINIIDSLCLFLLAGVIPGTNIAIPSDYMMILMVFCIGLVLFRKKSLLVFSFLKDSLSKVILVIAKLQKRDFKKLKFLFVYRH